MSSRVHVVGGGGAVAGTIDIKGADSVAAGAVDDHGQMGPAVGVQRNRVADVEVVGGCRTDGLRGDLYGRGCVQGIIVNDEPRAAGVRAILTRAGAQKLGMS